MAGPEIMRGLVLERVLFMAEPETAAMIACASRHLSAVTRSDALWRAFCRRDLDLSSPLDPDGNACASFKLAYVKWREAFAGYPWKLVLRVKKSSENLKEWMENNLPEVHATLNKGASEAEIEEAENKLRVRLPLPTRILFRFSNGQNTLREKLHFLSQGNKLGAIGGYESCNDRINVHLLCLSEIVRRTRIFIDKNDCSLPFGCIVVAASPCYRKAFLLDCSSGQLLVHYVQPEKGMMVPCAPRSLINLSPSHSGGESSQDGLLLWLEEHSRRLHAGLIGVRKRRMIIALPEIPISSRTVVCHGVEVCISTAFLPDQSDQNSGYYFMYCVGLNLSSEGCVQDGIRYSSFSARWRRGTIRESDVLLIDVTDPSFHWPECSPGIKFLYCKPVKLSAFPTTIDGSFTITLQRSMDEEGSSFEIEVPPVPFEIPSYIF